MVMVSEQTLLDGFQFPVWVKNAEFRYCQANRSFLSVLGMDLQQVVGKTDAELFPAWNPNALQALERLTLDENQPRQASLALPFLENQAFRVVLTPLADGQGLLGYVEPDRAASMAERLIREIVTLDVLADKRQSIKDMAERAKVISILSHEIRKPLSAIVSGANICHEELLGPLNTEQKEYMSLIESNGDVLLKNLDALLHVLHRVLAETE